MVRTSHSKALQNKPQGLTEQQPTPPVSTSCVGFFVFFFGYLHPARQQLRARVAPLAHGYHGARRHSADTPNQHLPHYLHYLHARRAGAMPRSPVVLSWAGCPRAGSLPCPHAAGTRGQALPGGKAQSTAPGQQQGTEPAPEHSWIISPLLHEPTAPGAALALPGGSPSPPAAPISIESGAAPPKRHWSERPSPRNWFGRRGQGEKFPTQNAGSGWPPFNRVPPRSPCAQGHRGDTPAPPQKRTVGSAMGITGTLCPGMLGQPQTMAQHCPSLHLNLL